MKGIAGAYIAVTGASGGIGLATCQWLADSGASVFALDLKPLEEQVGDFVQVDVTDPESVAGAAEEVLNRAGRIDGVVAGAGIAENDVAAENMDAATFDKVIGSIFVGSFSRARRSDDECSNRVTAGS